MNKNVVAEPEDQKGQGMTWRLVRQGDGSILQEQEKTWHGTNKSSSRQSNQK